MLFESHFKMFGAAIVVGLLALVSGGVLDGRIIGGQDASLGEFPHQVSLRYDGGHTCGGSIIHELYVLTAAHCVQGRDTPSKFTVITGSVLLTEGGEKHEVASIKYHEKFSTLTLDNDVAVIKLKKPIVFNVNQKPVALPKVNTAANLNVQLSGWGLTQYPSDVPPNHLKKMDLITYGNEECQKFHDQGPKRSNSISPGMLCGFNKLNVGACRGDSGGPLVLPGPNGPVQVGVVSWAWQYCALGVPDVYARVFYYLDWIHKNTDNVL